VNSNGSLSPGIIPPWADMPLGDLFPSWLSL